MMLSIIILIGILGQSGLQTVSKDTNCNECGRNHYSTHKYSKDIERYFSNTVIVLDTYEKEALNKALYALQGLGFEVRHVLPPDIVIGYFFGNVKMLTNLPFVEKVYQNFVPTDEVARLDKSRRELINAWNNLTQKYQKKKAVDVQVVQEPRPLINDVFPSIKQLMDEGKIEPKALSASDQFTSEYMIGSVTVGIIFMESSGSDENWTSSQESKVIEEIMEATDWLASTGNAINAMIYWEYDIHYKVPTDHEPIQEKHVPRYEWGSWKFTWINDALNYLGYGNGWKGMYDYLNDIRKEHETDWAYMVFVVDNENDDDYMFKDGVYSYSFSGGPCAVITYYNGSYWGPERLNEVFTHETGHIFYALDEYEGSGCSCTEKSGYLKVENGNCFECGPPFEQCIYQVGIGYCPTCLCSYTLGQIGWRDSDGDGALDPVDMNTGVSAYIQGVNPGDRIKIYNIGGGFVKFIAATPENTTTNGGNTFLIWDGTDYNGKICAQGNYFALINDVTSIGISLGPDNSPPYFYNLERTAEREFRYQLKDDDSYGDYVIIESQRVNYTEYWSEDFPEITRILNGELQCVNKSYLYTIGPSELPKGFYKIKLLAWDAGGNSATEWFGMLVGDYVDRFIDWRLNGWEIYSGSGGMSADWGYLETYLIEPGANPLSFGILFPEGPLDMNIPSSKRYLSFKIKDDNAFRFYVRVKGTDGNDYYLTYDPDDDLWSQTGTTVKYGIYGIGSEYQDGNWHTVYRDLELDLYRAFGSQTFGQSISHCLDHTKWICIRGDYLIDDIKISAEPPPAVVIDNFQFSSTESPLNHGWFIWDQGGAGANLSYIYDNTLNSQVLRANSAGDGYGFGIEIPDGVDMNISNLLKLLQFRIKNNLGYFRFYVRVYGTDDVVYSVVYEAQDGPNYFDNINNYAVYRIGQEYTNGKWFTITRDVDSDLYNMTGAHIDHIMHIALRGDYFLDDIVLRQTIPVAPTGLAYAIVNTDGLNVNLSWNSVSSAKKYIIYRKDTDDELYHIIGVTPNNSYQDNNVEANNVYQYRVAYVDIIDNESALSLPVTVDLKPPAEVSELEASPVDEHSIALSWVNPPDADLAGIRLLWKTGGYPQGPFDPSATVVNITDCTPNTEYSYTVSGLDANTWYYFAIFTYDDAGNYSSGKTVSTKTDITPPAEVSDLTATLWNPELYRAPGVQPPPQPDYYIILSWTNPTDADFSGVRVQYTAGYGYPEGPFDGSNCYAGNAGGPGASYTLQIGPVSYNTWYYFKVFTYDDVPNYSSGAEIAVKTPEIEWEASPPSGCPTLFVWEDSLFYEDNTILPACEHRPNYVMDYYKLRILPTVDGAGYKISIKEYETEHTWLDYVSLGVIEHPKDIAIGVTNDGKLIPYKNAITPISVLKDDEERVDDVTHENDGKSISCEPGDSIFVDFGEVPAADIYLGIGTLPSEPGMVAPKSPIYVYAHGSDWHLIGAFHPRGKVNFEFIDLPDETGELKLKLIYTGYGELDYMAIVFKEPIELTINKLPLESATHTRLGDIENIVSKPDSCYVQVLPAQEIDLEFGEYPTNCDTGLDFVFISSGFYLIETPYWDKLNAIDVLNSIRDSLSKKAKQELDKALKKFEKSIDTIYWQDEQHLNPSNGKAVFSHDQGGVHHLEKLLEDTNDVSALDMDRIRFCLRSLILKSDEMLALIAVAKFKRSDGEPSKLSILNAILDTAYSLVEKEEYREAIKKFGKVWRLANSFGHGSGAISGIQSIGKPLLCEFYIKPNPARELIEVHYSLTKNTDVRIRIYDISGRFVKEFVHKVHKSGKYVAECNMKDLSQGIYFVQIKVGKSVRAKKLIVVH